MLIRPIPGTPPEHIIKAINEAKTSVENLSTAHWDSPVKRRADYISWANATARQLHHAISPTDIRRLVLTPQFWHISSMPAGGATREDADTIGTEIIARRSELEELHAHLSKQIERWAGFGPYLVPDTTVFIQHPNRLENWDLDEFLVGGGLGGGDVHLLIPMVVVDELDRLKEAGKPHVRWRARYSLAVLDRVLKDPRKVGLLRPEEWNKDQGRITVELVFDGPGHVRLPNPDDEIVDQALTIDCLAGPKVTLLTYDTGMSTRARGASVACHKFTQPTEGDEPARA